MPCGDSLGGARRGGRRWRDGTEQSLEAPILRVGGYNVPYPPARIEEEFLPDLDRVLDAVDRSMTH